MIIICKKFQYYFHYQLFIYLFIYLFFFFKKYIHFLHHFVFLNYKKITKNKNLFVFSLSSILVSLFSPISQHFLAHLSTIKVIPRSNDHWSMTNQNETICAISLFSNDFCIFFKTTVRVCLVPWLTSLINIHQYYNQTDFIYSITNKNLCSIPKT